MQDKAAWAEMEWEKKENCGPAVYIMEMNADETAEAEDHAIKNSIPRDVVHEESGCSLVLKPDLNHSDNAEFYQKEDKLLTDDVPFRIQATGLGVTASADPTLAA